MPVDPTQTPEVSLPLIGDATLVREPASPVDAEGLYHSHGSFVWATLQRLGVLKSDCDDLFQEVFLVVHRGASRFRGDGAVSAWLFGICIRVVRAHRRRGYRVREQTVEVFPDGPAESADSDPANAAERREARSQLSEVLDSMDLEKRALFVMYEVDELSCEQIAGELGVPLGTVHSRLHAARREFERALRLWKARADNGRSR